MFDTPDVANVVALIACCWVILSFGPSGVVSNSLPQAVFRAVYTEVYADAWDVWLHNRELYHADAATNLLAAPREKHYGAAHLSLEYRED